MAAADQKTARIDYRERFHLSGFIFKRFGAFPGLFGLFIIQKLVRQQLAQMVSKSSSDSKFYSDWSFTGSFTFSQNKNTVTERC